MTQQHPGPEGEFGTSRLGHDDEPNDDERSRHEPGGGPRMALPPSRAGFPRPGSKPRISPVTAAIIAVLVCTVAAAVVLIAWKGSASSPSGPAPGIASAGGLGGAGAPVQGGGAAGGMLLMAGQVTTVSSAAITLGGQGRSVTAVFTSATQFDGQSKSASAIKVGDEVTVQIAGYGSAHPVVEAIQDPAQTP